MPTKELKADKVLLAAADEARTAAIAIAEPDTVGEHLGMTQVEERLATHTFACTAAGYPGWAWAVTVARVPRGKVATVCETNLVPGSHALLSPTWVPYSERLAPGDLGPGDVLPKVEDDPNLMFGFEATGDDDVDQMAFHELGLGRHRVLSPTGREAAATRWVEGEGGPSAEVALKSRAHCNSCGFFVPMAGALRAVFGVCANEWSPSDGRVVTLDHGCGAHSETDAAKPRPEPIGTPIIDDNRLDLSD
ncbi:MAG: DUF3027 domain-containing protein [Actinomycetia bacterium]|nr:DUF3027 domain-containing protein [Actinomycetes bacterium]